MGILKFTFFSCPPEKKVIWLGVSGSTLNLMSWACRGYTSIRKPWRDIFTYYLLLTTYYLLLITYYLLLITYYLSLITYYLLLIISFITPITAGNSKYTFPVTAVALVVVVVVVVAVYL